MRFYCGSGVRLDEQFPNLSPVTGARLQKKKKKRQQNADVWATPNIPVKGIQ